MKSSGKRVLAATWTVLGGALVTVLMLFTLQCSHDKDGSRSDYPSRTTSTRARARAPGQPRAERRLLSLQRLPRRDHEDQSSAPRCSRTITTISRLAHGDLWCLQCHVGRGPRLAAPLRRHGRRVRGILEALHAVPRKETRGLAGGSARKAHRSLVGAEGVPDLRLLPRSSLAAHSRESSRDRGPGDRKRSAARPPSPRKRVRRRSPMKSDDRDAPLDAKGASRRKFLRTAVAGAAAVTGVGALTGCEFDLESVLQRPFPRDVARGSRPGPRAAPEEVLHALRRRT